MTSKTIGFRGFLYFQTNPYTMFTMSMNQLPRHFNMASSLGMVFNWKVIHSNQLWVASTIRAISATFQRITGCWIRVFPKVLRFPANFRDSSRQTRAKRMLMAQKANRSWLKFCIMYWKPLPSFPSKLPEIPKAYQNISRHPLYSFVLFFTFAESGLNMMED